MQRADFLRAEGREDDWVELLADEDAEYDVDESIDLSEIEPLIAKPSSPGGVRARGCWRRNLTAVIGSSANPGLRDFAIAAAMVAGRQTAPQVSFDVNLTSREILADLTKMGATTELVVAGARIHRGRCAGASAWASASDRPQLAAHDAPQLSRPVGHQRGPRVVVFAGNRYRICVDGSDHRSAGLGA